MKLLHRFRYIGYDHTTLLQGVNKLSTFMSRLDKQAQEDHGMGWTPDEYKGMAFEALAELLIKLSPVDKRINIVNYEPHSARKHGKDVGIDGYGESHNGNKHTIQIKARWNTEIELKTKDGISNFVATTTAHPDYKDADMTVITSAKDVNQFLREKMYHNRVRVIGHAELTQLLDGNSAFWDTFRSKYGVK